MTNSDASAAFRQRAAASRRTVCLLGSHGPSILNFRAPLIRALRDAGHAVVAAAPERSAELTTAFGELGSEYVSVPMQRTGRNPLRDLRTFRALLALFRARRPHVVLSYSVKPVIYGTAAAAMAGVPRRVAVIPGLGYVFAENDGYGARVLRSVVRQMYGAALRRCHAVFFLNSRDEAEFEALSLPARGVDVHRIPGEGVDTAHYSPARLPDRPVFLCMSRLIAAKGLREYAEAARRLRAHHTNVTFALAGPLESAPGAIGAAELETWQSQHGIRYLGHLHDVRGALAEASVFVLPTYYREGLPRSIVEAMSMGRPVITTNTPGCAETIVDGECGLLVPPRDADALAAAMRRFIEDAELARGMGAAARRRAEARFDVDVVNRSIIEALSVGRAEYPHTA